LIIILELIDLEIACCREVNKLKRVFDDYDKIALSKKLNFINLSDLSKECGKRKFVLYDNYVCDVADYIQHHPGGAKMIEDYLHFDMAKYMTGTQPYTKEYEAYDHNYATTKQLLSMCYAVIKDNNGLVVSSQPSNLPITEKLELKNFSCELNQSYPLLKEKRDIASQIYEFRFGSHQKMNFARYLPGLFWIGRHFALSSTTLNKTRYYSVCHSLDPIYQEKFLALTENLRRLESK
jgi:hypothetical protein